MYSLSIRIVCMVGKLLMSFNFFESLIYFQVSCASNYGLETSISSNYGVSDLIFVFDKTQRFYCSELSKYFCFTVVKFTARTHLPCAIIIFTLWMPFVSSCLNRLSMRGSYAWKIPEDRGATTYLFYMYLH